ncbi:MAG TPA: DUF5723 family protein [Cyclobacteriaceae bacterium]
MIRQIRTLFLIVIFLFTVHIGFAQNEGTLYFMNALPQVNYLNPAIMPQYRFSLGLPGSSVYVQYANSGFAYNSLAKQTGDSTTADLSKLYSKLKKKNYITNAVQADLFRFSMKLNPRLYMTFNITAKEYNRLMLPKDLTGIFINGTSAYVGGKASLSPKVEAVSYVETGLGFAYKVDRKLTVGARIKILKGFANATTQRATANLAIDDDYAITASASADVRTSGIHNFTQDGYSFSDHWRDYTHNNGFAFDLGATYQVNDRLSVGGSLIDIGSIKWKNDTYAYTLDPANANYTFKGFDLQRVLNNDSDYLKHEGDTLQARFKFQEGSRGSYRTPIPGKLYLNGTYKLKANIYAGVLLFAEMFRGRFAPGVSTSVHREFGKRLSTSLSYTISNNAYNNIGLGLSLNLAPLQIYVVGDNLLRAPLSILAHGDVNPYLNNMQYFNLRAGLNFVFGWDKSPDKQPHPQKQL